MECVTGPAVFSPPRILGNISETWRGAVFLSLFPWIRDPEASVWAGGCVDGTDTPNNFDIEWPQAATRQPPNPEAVDDKRLGTQVQVLQKRKGKRKRRTRSSPRDMARARLVRRRRGRQEELQPMGNHIIDGVHTEPEEGPRFGTHDWSGRGRTVHSVLDPEPNEPIPALAGRQR